MKRKAGTSPLWLRWAALTGCVSLLALGRAYGGDVTGDDAHLTSNVYAGVDVCAGDDLYAGDRLEVTNSIKQVSSGVTNYLAAPTLVGTTTPGSYPARLYVTGGDLMVAGARVVLSKTGGGTSKEWSLHTDGEDFSLREYEGSDLEALRIQETVSDQYDFLLKADPATPGTWVVLLTSGNLGVGTTNALQKLHVAGAGRFDDGIAYSKNLGDLSMGCYTNQP